MQNTCQVVQLISAIAEGNKDQAQGINQTNRAVAQMDQVTQSNAANSEGSASASEELTAQAEEMNRMVRELIAMVTGGSASCPPSGTRVTRLSRTRLRNPIAWLRPSKSFL